MRKTGPELEDGFELRSLGGGESQISSFNMFLGSRLRAQRAGPGLPVRQAR